MAEKRYTENETERFKQEIHLPTLAQERYGMTIDKEKSTSKNPVFKHPDGADRFVMRQNESTGHWTYFEAGAGTRGQDSGSVIDFVQNRENLSFTQAKDALREYTGNADVRRVHVEAKHQASQKQQEAEANRLPRNDLEDKMKRESNAFEPNAYLMRERAIERETLQDPRFANKVRTNNRGSAVFPYTTMKDQATGSHFGGYEERGTYQKNGETQQWKNFEQPRGADKGLWVAGIPSKASQVVVSESAIDAMSYAQHIGDAGNPNSKIAYVATGGGVSAEAQRMLQAIERNNPNAQYTLAMDHGEGGQRFEERIQEALPNKELAKDYPEQGKDWNDSIQMDRKALELGKQQEADPLNQINSMVDQARGRQPQGETRDTAIENAQSMAARPGMDARMAQFQRDIEQELGPDARQQGAPEANRSETLEAINGMSGQQRPALSDSAAMDHAQSNAGQAERSLGQMESGKKLSPAAAEAKRANEERDKERDGGRGREGEGRGTGSPALKPDMSQRDAPGREMEMGM